MRKMGKNRRRIDKCSLFAVLNVAVTLAVLLIVVGTLGLVLLWGLPHLGQSLRTEEVQFAVMLSIKTSLMSTLLCLILALPVAYTLVRHSFPGRNLVVLVLNLPLALPPLISGVALLLFFGTSPFGHLLNHFGLSPVFTVEGIVLAQTFVNLPYLVALLKTTLEGVDKRLDFVARTLGCTPFSAFRRVTVPLIRPGLISGLILTWNRALGEFGAVLMLAGATRMRTETLPIAIFLNISVGDLDSAMAVSSILILVGILSHLIMKTLEGKHVRYNRL